MGGEPYEKTLRGIRVFPSTSTPRHPVESLGAVAGYAGGRLQRKHAI